MVSLIWACALAKVVGMDDLLYHAHSTSPTSSVNDGICHLTAYYPPKHDYL